MGTCNANDAKDGAGAAINRYLVKAEFAVDFISPETIHIELFQSIGGAIPVITSENSVDFENMVRNIVFRGKEVPHEISDSLVKGMAISKCIQRICLAHPCQLSEKLL